MQMAQTSASSSTRQPGKTLYTLFTIFSFLLKLPSWLVYYIPRRLRPHPQWTYKQAVRNKILRVILQYQSAIHAKTPRILKPGNEKDRFVLIEPGHSRLYQGILNDPDVRPSTIGAVWHPSPPSTSDIEKNTFVIHFHGGAFVTGTGRDPECAFGGKLIASGTSSYVLMVDYRLSSNPGGQFPAALQDAITAYHYLLEQGISSSRIAVSGDSAGGNLAIALLRYISETRDEQNLPAPGFALLWSPWLDLHAAQDPIYVTSNKRTSTDYIPDNFTTWGVETYVPPSVKADNPYISPLRHPFACKTRVWIQTGGVEVLLDEDLTFAKQMQEVKENVVELHVEPYASHDLVMAGQFTGFEMEMKRCAELAGGFMKRNGFGE